MLPRLPSEGWLLVVVGRGANPALARRLRLRPDIESLSDAPSLAPVYARAHLVVVLLYSGGDTKLKTVGAFAHLRPMMATAHGVRGLGLQPGFHYLVADDAAGFAAHLLRLWREPALARRLSSAAQARHAEAFAFPSALVA